MKSLTALHIILVFLLFNFEHVSCIALLLVFNRFIKTNSFGK